MARSSDHLPALPKGFSLTREEKKSMREQLKADMKLMKEMFPMRFAGAASTSLADLNTAELWQGRSKLIMKVRKFSQPVRERSTFSQVASFVQEMTRALSPIAALFIVLAGVSTAMSAERALPGDSLYWVKVHITEPIRGALYLFPEAQAEWDVQLLERRLQEAEIVAEEEGLASYATYVNRHLEQLAGEIQQSIDQESDAGEQQEMRGLVYSVMVDHQETVRELVRNQRERTYMRALIQKLEQRASPRTVESFRQESVNLLSEPIPVQPEGPVTDTPSTIGNSSSISLPPTPAGPGRNSIINRTMRKLQRQSDDRVNGNIP